MTIKKEDRLNLIKEIIANHNISSQDELLNQLVGQGFDLTQATLSRDLKYLKVGRIPTEDGFKYVLSNEFVGSSNNNNQSAVVMGFISIEFSGNIGVIKTLPAYSHTIADFIDKSGMDEVAGTVAGNDTVMVVVREGYTSKHLIEAILNEMPELKYKIDI